MVYSTWSSLTYDKYPRISTLLQALEQAANMQASLLRQCLDLYTSGDADFTPIVVSRGTDTDDWKEETPKPERIKTIEDIYTINKLKESIDFWPDGEKSDETVKLIFWYIKEGKNESVEMEIPGHRNFGQILIEVMDKAYSNETGNFSVSPLGFEPLTLEEFRLSAQAVISKYDYEFTIISMV
jgi:hypothetical protein